MADGNPANNDALKRYWTRDPRGLARWATKPHPWTALYRELVKHVGPERAKRITESFFVAVFGYHSGSRKGQNPVGPG